MKWNSKYLLSSKTKLVLYYLKKKCIVLDSSKNCIIFRLGPFQKGKNISKQRRLPWHWLLSWHTCFSWHMTLSWHHLTLLTLCLHLTLAPRSRPCFSPFHQVVTTSPIVVFPLLSDCHLVDTRLSPLLPYTTIFIVRSLQRWGSIFLASLADPGKARDCSTNTSVTD